MARSSFPVEVLTPEGEVWNGEVEMLSTRTTTGSVGVLANHSPLMAILEPTELRLYQSETDVVRFAQAEGYLQVVNNSALVLVEDAIEGLVAERFELGEDPPCRYCSFRALCDRHARGQEPPW